MENAGMPAGANLTVTFQVVDGVDKGRVFRGLPVPLTIGREEGNILRLNDERVSRFHAKVQQDGNDLILTDLESTHVTRVNRHLGPVWRRSWISCITTSRSPPSTSAPTRTAHRSRLPSMTGKAYWPCKICWHAISAPSPSRMPWNSEDIAAEHLPVRSPSYRAIFVP